jgi:hypothetical protein
MKVSGTTPFTDYAFKVRAINGNGAGAWSNEITAQFNFNEATGGTVTEYDDGGTRYRMHTFTSSGTFTVNVAPKPFRVGAIGGGGGGADGLHYMGGGNAGSLAENAALTLPQAAIPVAVGAGGHGGTNADGSGGSSLGGAGGTSSLGTLLTAAGGAPRNGGGGGRFAPGAPGPTSKVCGVDVTAGAGGGGGGDCGGGGCPAGGGGSGVVVISYQIA